MTVKNRMIQLLEENRGALLSGQEIADRLGVTRAAVWKAVRVLQEEGYHITSVKNKGYCLETENDVLSAEGIKVYLPERYAGIPVEVLKSVDSTNNYAKRMAAGQTEACVILAEEQTEGRGRRRREFFSPFGTGIYMSIVFPVETSLAKFVPITVAASVAVVRAIRRLTGKEAGIKWVNDVFLDGKKICGILTEAVSDFESGMLTTVIVGIGLNVSTTDYPEELREIAGSLLPEGIHRNQLVAAIVSELLDLSQQLEHPGLMEEYRQCSVVIGKEITWLDKEQTKEGIAVNIDEQGHLQVQTEEGMETLVAGEISIRRRRQHE